MAVEVVAKRWGNSLGIVLPKELVRERAIKENERLRIEVVKVFDVKEFRARIGTLPPAKTKMTTQQLKDMARAGWD
jgi:antitoxin component of MazEF toxin-antitoxin module